MRRFITATAAALALVAFMATPAFAGWKVQTTGGTPYAGAATLSLSTANARFTTGSGIFDCNNATASLSITDSGSVSGVPAGNVASGQFGHNGAATCPTGLWMGNTDPALGGFAFTIGNRPGGGGAAMLAPSVPMTMTFQGAPGFVYNYLSGQFDPAISTVSGTATLNVNEVFTRQGYSPLVNYTLTTYYRLRGVDGSGNPINLVVVATP
jgi:hypothetical protein